MEYSAFHLEVSELNPVQVTRNPKLLPSSVRPMACVTWPGGLSVRRTTVRVPAEGSAGTYTGLAFEKKTPVVQSPGRRLGVALLHRVV